MFFSSEMGTFKRHNFLINEGESLAKRKWGNEIYSSTQAFHPWRTCWNNHWIYPEHHRTMIGVIVSGCCCFFLICYGAYPKSLGKAAVHGVAKSWTRLSDFTFTFHFPLSCIEGGNGNPLQCSCLENPRYGGAWWAAIYGVTQSRTRLKQLSSSSKRVIVNLQGESHT